MLPDDSFFKVKTLITISFILVFQLLYSQNTTIDSLETALKNHKAKDTVRVNLLNHLAFNHYRNNPPKAVAYIEESLELANKLKVQKFIAHCEETDKKSFKNEVNKDEKVIILIGPEGDFSTKEINLAIENNFIPVTLGNTRLRTETAALVACHTIALINE